jgi:hypothetical protein
VCTALVQRMLEAAAALAAARDSDAQGAGERIEAQRAELETRLQAEAAEQLEALLAGGGPPSAGFAAPSRAALAAAPDPAT